MTIYPTPSPQGIAKLQAFYLDEYGMTLSDEQAYDILGGVMRFLYLTRVKPAREQAHAQRGPDRNIPPASTRLPHP